MPLPLVVWGLGALVAAGAGLAGKGAMDNSKANDVQSDAAYIQRNAEKKLEYERDETNKKFENYGLQKIKTQEEKISNFLNVFSKIKNVEFQSNTKFDNLSYANSNSITLSDIQVSYNALTNMAKGLAGGAASGALVAYGAYAGTMAFATASTGTAISGLAGAAAVKATLAWLGGGALSVGGAGIAGGTMVLGGLVAGPALLIFGGITAANASKKLDEARSNRVKASEYSDEVDEICIKLSMMQEVTVLASTLLSQLSTKMRRSTKALERIVNTSGTNYLDYDDEEKKAVFIAFKYAQVTAALLETSILNEDGGMKASIKEDLHELEDDLTDLSI